VGGQTKNPSHFKATKRSTVRRKVTNTQNGSGNNSVRFFVRENGFLVGGGDFLDYGYGSFEGSLVSVDSFTDT
jgi:hypothetical protein